MNRHIEPTCAEDVSPVNKSVSKLKQDFADKKEKKQQKQVQRATGTKATKKVYWNELHPMINNIHALLVEYGHIGVAGEQSIPLIKAEAKQVFLNNIKMIFEDTTTFMNRLNFIKTKVKDTDEPVAEDVITDFYALYMDLDELYTDITIALTPVATDITKAIAEVAEATAPKAEADVAHV